MMMMLLLLVSATPFLAGCGGSSEVTAAGITRCVLEGGGDRWTQVPLKPDGFPRHLRSSVTVGPNRGHITVYLSERPVFNQRLANGFDELGEYHATVVLSHRGLVLLDNDITKRDERLAFECAE